MKVVDNMGKIVGGVLILYIGLVYLLQVLGIYTAGLEAHWPELLIIIGAGIIARYMMKK